MFIHGLFVIRPWSNRQTALLPQGLVPYGLKGFFSSLPASSRQQRILCCGVGCSPWQGPRSSSPMIMVCPAIAQPPLPTRWESCQPHPPAAAISLFYIALKLLSSCCRSPSAEASMSRHAGPRCKRFWAALPSQAHLPLTVLSPRFPREWLSPL